jgi:uncharacterized protein YbjT (DUF2867 family)
LPKRVLVTGPTGFLGLRVLRALVEEGAEVSALVRPGSEDKLGVLRHRVQIVPGDVWNPASLKGRARGHQVVVHLIGGTRPDPKRGVTFRTLNYDSARNVAQMAVSDGVSHFIFLSAAAALPGVQAGYLDNKRDAEQYLQSTGLAWTILRAPPLYMPGMRRNPAYALLSVLRFLPPFSFVAGNWSPLSADIAARAIARLAIDADPVRNRLIQPGRIRALGRLPSQQREVVAPPAQPDSIDAQDEAPFGWLP